MRRTHTASQARTKVANLDDLQVQGQQLAKIMEEEMTHHEQESVLSHMHLQKVEEVKAQSQEIRCLSPLVEEQQEAIKIVRTS